MGFLERLFDKRAWSNTDGRWYSPIAALNPTHSGVTVDEDSAMRCATVFACVRVLAESIASLPVILYRRLPGGGKERAARHWAHRLVHDRPSPKMSPFQWKSTGVAHVALVGNHYSEMIWSNRGEVLEFVPYQPSQVSVKIADSGELRYEVRMSDAAKPRIVTEPNMFHLPGMAWNGLTGMSPIGYARETIGLALAGEEFGSRFFGNGTNVGTVFTLPAGTRWDDEQTQKFLQDLKEKHGGLGKSHNSLALPAGMTLERLGIPPEDAQFLETRQFQQAQIASIFRVPLHLIQQHEKSTTWGSGLEQITAGFVIYTLRPWLVQIEQTLNRKLLTEDEQEEYFFEFLIEGLLRGDQQARAEYYTAAITSGWMNPNEVRERENLNPYDGGDEFMPAANIFGQPPGDASPDENALCDCGHEHRAERQEHVGSRQTIQRSYIRVIADAMARVMRRERQDVLNAATKAMRRRGVEDLIASVEEFYTEHEEFTREQIRPAFEALAEAVGAEAMREIEQDWAWNEALRAWVDKYIEAFANRHSNRSRQQLLDVISAAVADELDVVDALTQRFDEWEGGITEDAANRATKIAAENSVRLGQGFSRAVWAAGGVAALVWVNTGGETCPYCTALNGRTVGIQNPFLSAGQDFAPGDQEPLRPSSDVYHPPAHAGCDCVIITGG